VPSQVAVAFKIVGHGEHELPQVAGAVVETHAPPQAWNPALQVKPHTPAAHVVFANATIGQVWVHEPQWFGSVAVFTHMLSQRVGVMPEQLFAHAYVPVAFIEHIGVGSAHATPQAPQFEAVETFVSQPSSARLVQCA
jgi:hypothetical protein